MRRIAPFFLGLSLGAGAAWLALSREASHPSPSASRPLQSSTQLLPPARLAAPEADAALAAFLALPRLPADVPPPDFAERSARLRALLTILPDTHLPPLLAALITRPDEPEARLRNLAFTVWCERDAPAAARWAVELTPSDTLEPSARNAHARQAVLAWADTDLEAALAFTFALPDSALVRELGRPLLAKLAETDPERALALARAQGDAFLNSARAALFNAWAKRDPAAAVRALGTELANKDGMDAYHLQQAVTLWLKRDTPAALDWFIRAQTTERHIAANTVTNYVINLFNDIADPSAVANALANHPDLPDRQSVLSSFLRQWVHKGSADAVLAWLDGMPDAAARIDLIGSMLPSGAAPQTAAAYLPLALRLPPGPDRDIKLANYLAAWSEQDAPAALAWLRAQNDPSLVSVGARLEGHFIAQLAATDLPAALARWQALPPGETRDTAVASLAQAMARQDPAAATRLLAAQPLPATQSGSHSAFSVLQSSFTEWYRQKPDAALAWAETFPDGNLRLSLLSSLLQSAGLSAPAAIDRSVHADRLASLQNPRIRDEALTAHLRQWRYYDPAAAKTWIENHDALSPEAAAKLLAAPLPQP